MNEGSLSFAPAGTDPNDTEAWTDISDAIQELGATAQQAAETVNRLAEFLDPRAGYERAKAEYNARRKAEIRTVAAETAKLRGAKPNAREYHRFIQELAKNLPEKDQEQ